MIEESAGGKRAEDDRGRGTGHVGSRGSEWMGRTRPTVLSYVISYDNHSSDLRSGLSKTAQGIASIYGRGAGIARKIAGL